LTLNTSRLLKSNKRTVDVNSSNGDYQNHNLDDKIESNEINENTDLDKTSTPYLNNKLDKVQADHSETNELSQHSNNHKMMEKIKQRCIIVASLPLALYCIQSSNLYPIAIASVSAIMAFQHSSKDN